MKTPLLNFELDLAQLAENEEQFAAITAQLWQKVDPESFGKLAQGLLDQEVLWEPLLLYYLYEQPKHRVTLPQILLGYHEKPQAVGEVAAVADAHGWIYLPELGYLPGTPRGQHRVAKVAHGYTVDGQPQRLHPEVVLKNGLRLYQHSPLILFDKEDYRDVQPTMEVMAQERPLLEKALALIAQLNPTLEEAYQISLRGYGVYHGEGMNSFAHINYPHAAFSNTLGALGTVPFYLDDVAHQAGHVVFNTLTLEANRYLAVPKDTPFRDFTDEPQEVRPVYGAFHGLFTYTCILDVLDRYVSQQQYTTEQEHREALARMGFYVRKMIKDLHRFHNDRIFTEEGQRYFWSFVEGYKALFARHGQKLESFSYEGQPYVFDWQIFEAKNTENLSQILNE